MSKTADLIRQHAGKLPAAEIAELAGVTRSTIVTTASRLDVSLRMPRRGAYPRTYLIHVPQGREQEIADILEAVKKSHSIQRTTNAWIKLAEMAAEQL